MTDQLLGTLLDGRYRLVARIARGGMSTVYQAVDERLDRTVAVKVMAPELAADPQFLARFTREARATARLSSPYVVAVFDQGSHDGLAYLVMEFVSGRTLRDLLAERGRLDPATAVSILESVLMALAAAHRAGLVHRDVKPENVLLGDDGTVKVADFGLARAVQASSHTATRGILLGTVAYLAPEQVTHGSADERTDVYAAGLVLFELLTGTVPFTGETAMSVAYRHATDDVPPPSSRVPVPDALDALVQRATRRDPGARPADAGTFLAELHDVRADLALPLAAVPSAPASHPHPPSRHAPARHTIAVPVERAPGRPRDRRRRRPHRRRNGLIATLVVVLLALGVAGAGWWVGSGRYTTVPSYYGLTQAQADQRISADGFHERTGDAVFSETVAKGIVAEQSPAQEARILRDGTVTLHLSKGPERYFVPKLAGQDQAGAEAALRALHLNPQITDAYSASVANGKVVSVVPGPGSALRRDTAVRLVVSKGPPPVPVPDVTGRSVDDAKQALATVGLEAKVTQAYDQKIPSGNVLSQAPSSGTVSRGATIALTVSKGPPPVTVPDVTGMKRKDAEQRLTAAGLHVRVLGGNGRVVQQSPGGGEQVPQGSRVTLLVLF